MVPLSTMMLAIWLSGLLTATIVTATHQSEEIFMLESSRRYDFVEAQFRSTRDAEIMNPFSSTLWGGMQWQLEHHLFPTIPRYRYPALSYRESEELPILIDNIRTINRQATLPAQPGNPNS